MKKIKTVFAILLSSIFLLFSQNEASAFLCLPPKAPIHIAICDNNVCKEGFEIYYERVPHGCKTIPTVKENVLNIDKIFQRVFSENNIQNAKGIYEISSEGVVTRLTESTSLEDLYSYKSQWLSKEAEERKLVGEDKWNKILALIIPAILIIGWPLVIIALKPLRRRLNLTALLVVALTVNLGFFILQPFFSISLGGEYPEEILVHKTIYWSILLVIILEFVFLIFRIGKRLFHRAQ